MDVSDELSFYKEGVLLKPDDILNKETVKLLYNSGVTFLKGQFFESRMPTESGKLNRNLMSKIIPVLLNGGVSLLMAGESVPLSCKGLAAAGIFV